MDYGDEEIWIPIKELHKRYEASSYGRIRNSQTKRIKAQVYDGHYMKFGYDYMHNGERYRGWYRVHKAIAEEFIPNPENKPTVNHIDGDRQNNCAYNLEWATAKEQSIHARDELKVHCGENNYSAKHTNDDVREMRRLSEEDGLSVKEIAKMYGDNENNVRRILNYTRWAHI